MQGNPDETGGLRHICLSPPQQAELHADSLGEKLRIVIGNLPQGGVTLAEIRDLVGQDGLLLLTIFLTLGFMVPVSIPGVSVVFGSAILLIGVSRLRGRTLWLPKRLAHRVLPAEKVRAAFIKGSIWLRRLERVSRPHRLNGLASAGWADTVNSGALITGSLLLMAPVILVPFSNTLPALALLFLSIGLLQRDGLCILIGHLANFVTVIYFAGILVGGEAAFREAFQHLGG